MHNAEESVSEPVSTDSVLSESAAFKSIDIVFDNTEKVYCSGKTVTGRVVLNHDGPINANGIKIKCKGEAQVYFTDRSAGIRRKFSSDETYLQEEVYIYGNCSEEKMVPSGSYPFSIALPEKLPCSFEGLYGRVRYSIIATFVITSELKFSTNPIPFTIVSTVDLNSDSLAPLPISESMSKTFMGQSEPLTVAVSLPVRGFVPGQTIPVKIDVQNDSSLDVRKLRIIFKKVVTYHATEKSRKHKEVIVEIQQPVSKNTELYEVGVDVPSVPPTGMTGCKIINVMYTLKVEAFADINEWYYKVFHKNLKIRMPIVIGTIPLKNYENPENTDFDIKEEKSSNAYENVDLSLPPLSLRYEETKIYRSSKPNKDDPTGEEGESDGKVEPYFPMYRVYKFDGTKKRGGTS
ncbi:arrestin domain-containing protein 17-like [Belonocnema kinseyi]|uniref:arrestin domain-containing protein 17-like n=1 Tax=Belonocnema kinseyi TaxID=2817044 RepID=UPI00143DA787|nr:arrestin domain-containing protein 17-like [Belonocnema kinseyi]